MASLNRVVLVGRLTRDPELRHTTSGLAIVTFTLAVDRRYKSQSGEKQTDFIRCKAWRQTAEFVHKYITKGRLVGVEGSIETSESTGPDGQRRYFTDIVCDNVTTLDSARGEGGGQGGYGGQDDYQDRGGGGGGDNGYFSDDDMGAPPPRAAAAPRASNAVQRPPAKQAPARQAPAPSAYPEEDFDDSDPFADE